MCNPFQKKERGFTLVELVVVVGIMSGIMLLVFFNSNRFNDDLSLRTAATEISLVLRQAQNFGVSVRESTTGEFNAPYGIAFDMSNRTNAFIYSDIDNDRAYDGTLPCTGSDECREKILLRGGILINNLCATYLADPTVLSCFGENSLRYMVVTYVRPDPEPVIKFFNSNGIEISGPWKTAYVELKSSNGTLMYVTTDTTSGIITLQNTMP